MDSQYGIAVNNKFDLFWDDVNDPIEFLNQQEELKKKQELAKEKDKGKQGKEKKAKKQNASQSDNKSIEQSVQKKEGNVRILNLGCSVILVRISAHGNVQHIGMVPCLAANDSKIKIIFCNSVLFKSMFVHK